MITMRETKADKSHEERLLIAMARHLGCTHKQSPNLKKYRLDGWFHNGAEPDSRGDMLGWAECKWYGDNKKAFCALNVPKYMEMVNLSQTTMLPSYFIFRENNRFGYIVVHDGLMHRAKFKVSQAGGTAKGRQPNPDDIEPLIMFDKSEIIWGN